MIQKTKRPVSILLVLLMIVGMFSVLPISASAAEWTFKLNSNFSGEWNADTDVVSEQPVELNLSAGDYEFEIVAYEDGNLSSYRGNAQAGSSTETYSQTMHDNGGHAKFHADGGKYTLTYNAGSGVLTIKPVYVAEIDGTYYKTLEAAIAAISTVTPEYHSKSGLTINKYEAKGSIKLLADCAGNGIVIDSGSGLTIDFDGHTYTVDGDLVGSNGTESLGFQLLKNSDVAFENGTITSKKAKILVQNYSNLGLYGMTLTLNNPDYTSAYTLSNNNGNAGIHNTTINANPAGGFAFDVCRYSSYPSVHVEVTGEESVINGNVEISASKGQAMDGFYLNLDGGTMNGDIVVTPSAAAAMESAPDKASVNKAAGFDQTAPEGFKWVDNGQGGSTLVALPYAAMIGNTKYRTLEEAFAAAVDGDTITVLADCTGNGIVVPQGKFNNNGLTVDFIDYTYTIDGETVGSTGTETNGFQLLKDNKVTFIGGTIYSEKAKILVQNYSDLTLQGMTLTLANPNYTSAYTLSNNNGNVVIDSTTINANTAGGFAFDVCRFSSYPFVHVTVKGGSDIQGDVEISASKGDAKEGFSLTLEGGSMTGNIVVDASAQALVGEKNKVTKADSFTKDAPEGFKWVSNEDGTASLAPVTYVAKIGDTKYETLAAAIGAAQTGDAITLLDNIALTGAKWFVVDKDLTIDLGGKNISSEDSVFVLKDGADLTVKNGTMTTSVSNDYAIYVNNGSVFTLNSDATLKATNSNGNGIIVRDGGKAVINGTVESGYYSIAGFGSAVVDVNAGASITSTDASALSGNGSDGNEGYTFNINGGTLTSVNDVVIYHPNQGALNITGGTITGATAIYVKSGSTDISTSTTSISGATITGNGAAKALVHSGNGCNPTGDAIVIENCGYPGGTPAIDISGGTIVSENADPVHSYGYNDYQPIEKFVSGGTFNKAVPADYAADGYIPVDNGDGTYTVDGPYVAAIGTTGYATLEAAFAAAQDGKTITVLADCAGNGIVVPQGKFTTGLTVDFDGHTYDVSGTPVGSKGTETIGFQLLKDNKITFKNGTITGDSRITRNNSYLLRMIQNYSDLTLDNMTVSMVGQYYDQITVSTCNGKTVIKDSTISAADFTWLGYDDPADVRAAALAVGTFSSYPSIDVTVEGESTINGDVNVSDDNNKKAFSLTLKGGKLNGNINLDETAKAAIDDTESTANVTKADSFTQEAPEGYRWVDSAETGKKTLAPIPYVAKIGETKYETLEAAFAAAKDGETITVLTDCAGNGIKAPQGKFASGLTVDFGGKTYTVDGETVGSTGTETNGFQLLKDNKITFKNGTITSTKAKILVQNYSDLTLEGMTLTLNNPNYASAYTLSNNNGDVVINNTTINANPEGGFAFDVCRYASYPSVKVTVTGDSKINGDVEVYASGNDPKEGFSLNLNGGTMTGDIVLDASAETAMNAAPEKVSVTKASGFDQEAPEGYMWVDTETAGVQTIAKAVAQIDETNYATLEAAFAAAVDGDTINVLADSAGNGIKAPQGKFATGLTVDFNDHTYTVDGTTVGSTGTETQAFQLLKGNTITFKNGTITSDKAKMIVQNYSNLTLDNMVLDGTNMAGDGNYVLSNNNGNVVINDTTIDAREGCIAFDVCRYASYPSVKVTVTGGSEINGDVEVYASDNDPKDGFSLNLESGSMDGKIIVDKTAAAAMANTPEKASVNKKNTFEQDPAEGYEWKAIDENTSTLVKIPDLFAGYGLSLQGDIGLIFYLDPAAADIDIADVDSVEIDFDCDHYTYHVKDFTTSGNHIKVTCYVPAAYMAHDIKAYHVKINGVALDDTDTYSIQQYAETLIEHPEYTPAGKNHDHLAKLMKEMLNYGAKAQEVFKGQMIAPADYDDLAEKYDYNMATVDADTIGKAIHGKATDMSTVHPEPDANFYAPSVIYLSKTTLRMIFLIPTGNGSQLPADAYTGHQGVWYHYVDVTDIAAAKLDEQQEFEINGVTFYYSVLDYAKGVVAGGSPAQKDLAASLYLYNQAANAYFGD